MRRFLVLGVVIACAGARLFANDERLKDAEVVLKEMAGAPDAGVPASLFAKAKCAVVIPGLKKFALAFGGQYGRGYLSCRTSGGWSAPGGVRIEGGSFGLQIGGSSTDVIMLVMNERGVDRMLSSKFTLGADATVAAGPVGRKAAAQTDATMMAEILAWSRSRGVFAGIALEGATLREDSGENKELYGSELPNRQIVTGRTAIPAAAAGFIKALGKF